MIETIAQSVPDAPALPRFKKPEPYDARQPCISCGHIDVESRWCDTALKVKLATLTSRQKAESLIMRCFTAGCFLPHIHRDCRRCGRAYVQRPLDVPEEDYAPEAVAARAQKVLDQVTAYLNEKFAQLHRAGALAQADAEIESEPAYPGGRRRRWPR